MEKMSSGANNGAKPLKSILKITRPKGAAGDTIDAAGAGKTKMDGVGIQPFKVRRKVSIAPDGTEHVFTYVQTECSDHVCSSVQMNEVHQVDTNGNPNVADADLCQVRCNGDQIYGSLCNEGNKSFANLFNDMGGVMDSNEARSDWGGVAIFDKVKNKYENSLVGYFIGKSLAFPIVQNYVNNTWGKFGLQKLMRNDDGIFLFKFADESGNGQHDTDLKKEVIMVVPNEDGTSYTREFISVEYEWQPPRCADCKNFGHSDDKCPKIVREPVTCTTPVMNSDGFTEVKRKKNKGKKADQQPRARHIDGIRLTNPKPNFYWQKTGANKSGADLVNKGPTDANSSINKVNGPSTSNSFDILNNVDEGDACCVSSSMGNQEVDQAVGHATVIARMNGFSVLFGRFVPRIFVSFTRPWFSNDYHSDAVQTGQIQNTCTHPPILKEKAIGRTQNCFAFAKAHHTPQIDPEDCHLRRSSTLCKNVSQQILLALKIRIFTDYENLGKCLEYIEELMIRHVPIDGLAGFSQGAILSVNFYLYCYHGGLVFNNCVDESANIGIASDHEEERSANEVNAARGVRQMYGEFFKPCVVGLLLNNEMK
ncbi:uncharacterized vacuolar membrane protein [Tanacetum coccineum]